jgi:putative transposase
VSRDIVRRKERKTARYERRAYELLDRNALSLFRREEMEALAREAGFYERAPREIRAFEFVLCCALGSVLEGKRGFAGVWRLLSALGVTVARSAVTQRFGEGSAKLMEAAFRLAVERLPRPAHPEMLGKLDEFRAVLAQDATVVTLSPLLQKLFPATRTNSVAAAGKVHASADVVHRRIEAVKVTGEREGDLEAARSMPIERDTLYLNDLGYFCYDRFAEIVEGGAHFASRLKENANPVIVGVRHGLRTPAEAVAKRLRLNDEALISCLAVSRDTFDLDVEVEGEKKGRMQLRLVGCFNPAANRIHWYITSLPAEKFSPEEVATLYSLRWVVELLFKLLKSSCHLDHVDTSDPDALRTHIYASLLAATILSAVTAVAVEVEGLPAGLVSPLVVGHAAPMLVIPLLALWLGRPLTLEELSAFIIRLIAFGCTDQNPRRTRAKWGRLRRN